MYPLFETIKVYNRQLFNLDYHSERLNKSRKILFGTEHSIDLMDEISIPESLTNGLYKCRILYSDKGLGPVEYFPYRLKKIKSLQIVHSDDIDYSYKHTDRSPIDNLLLKKGKCDEILIIKKGFITDSSICNVVFFDGKKWITPALPLLKGTRRAKLLDARKIIEDEIRERDFKKFKKVALINIFRDLGDNIISTTNIYWI